MYVCIISNTLYWDIHTYCHALCCKYICILSSNTFSCVGSVSSLISGYPYNNINVNTIAADYSKIFTTIVTRERVS